ncbi:hypothetical protein [Pseudonocardia sp. WMMC193]|uniref:hypothetical protein n=1 Tax=Pseudonocardia sp. WMMC193 TaxID=2911965 RepID=UPI001F34899B|nr:hypothetical protein [Pseudonocardia sp. WMMC193]MCF7549651.1 hypothetical protein [Pseudonocardia sp. WMMC193]
MPPPPTSVLLWRADDCAAAGPVHACCLRETAPGARAVVYRTRAEQGIAGVVDFTAAAGPRPDGGWAAPGVFVPLADPVPRAALLADDTLRPVFATLRSRRRLPEPAARLLARMIDPPADPRPDR